MSSKEVIEIDENELKKENNRQFARNINGYSQVGDIDKIYKEIYRPRKINRQQIRRAMENPLSSSDILQQTAEIMKYTNGILKEFLIYKSNILTCDHYILPINVSKYKTLEDAEKAEYNAALQLEKYKLKFNAKWMIERIINQGELYIYKAEDKDGIIIQEIPSIYCMATGNKNTVMKYAINLSKLNDKNINYFPLEIQNIYKRFKNNKLGNDKNLLEGNYYKLGNNATCFNIEYMSSKGVPYYSHLFDDLMTLEDMKDIETANAKVENFKLVIQKALTDDEGNLLMDYDDILQYHQHLKENVPDGVGTITTPMPVDSITLGDNKSKTLDYNNKLKDGIYDSAGINSSIMNGEKSSNEAISLGSVVDTLLPLKILEMIQIWANEDMKQNNKTKNWMLTFVDSTRYNKRLLIKDSRENSASWTSKKEYMALQGHTPLSAFNVLKYEELTKMNDKLQPLLTAHTMSSSGRPDNADSTDTSLTTGQSEN